MPTQPSVLHAFQPFYPMFVAANGLRTQGENRRRGKQQKPESICFVLNDGGRLCGLPFPGLRNMQCWTINWLLHLVWAGMCVRLVVDEPFLWFGTGFGQSYAIILGPPLHLSLYFILSLYYFLLYAFVNSGSLP